MAIKDVETKCWILALFIRDDGERFLLGSGAYEFKDSQQHFAANTMSNDVVEVQGNDGYLLAGQVRRPSAQSFDGYVGDSSTSKPVVESLRRDFFAFFRKNHFYKVIYVFPDGSAIQRKRGFLVDAPEVKEIYQIYPEYHVALNFEDVNYYYYNENAEGEEIYGKSAMIGLSMATGGLVWDADGAVTEGLTYTGVVTVSGVDLTINNEMSIPAPITDFVIRGNTYQQTYSGKNLLPFPYPGRNISNGMTFTNNGDGSITLNGTNSGNGNSAYYLYDSASPIPTLSTGTYYFANPGNTNIGFVTYDGSKYTDFTNNNNYSNTLATVPRQIYIQVQRGNTTTFNNVKVWPMLTTLPGQTAADYEPYVGGIPSPNPDYPQNVQVVTGEQTVEMTGKNLYEGSQDFSGTWNNSQAWTTETEKYNGLTVLSRSGSWTGIYKPINVEAGKTYTFSVYVRSSASSRVDMYLVNIGTATASVVPGNKYFTPTPNWQRYSVTFTVTNSGTVCPRIENISNQSSPTYICGYQLEEGSSMTGYEPYRSQSYIINLGSIELCKIGDYQDYIYKSGGKWYVHKETNKVILNGSENWNRSTYSNSNNFYITKEDAALNPNSESAKIRSDLFRGRTISWSGGNEYYAICLQTAEHQIRIFYPQSLISTVNDFKTWLSSHNVTTYYVMDNAYYTDTQITNQALIDQLEAVGAAKLFVGENNITTTVASGTVQPELEIGYYTGVEDGYGFVWEEGRQPSDIVTVDSVDRVYPLLTITGETVNPVITNVTTGTILRYNGTITASQTLVIDMMNQTATLNGVSVLGNITGDWIYFDPGNNRVTYTTNNATAPDATIEWQEIVG